VNRIDRSEITPEHVYLNRRRFMAGLGTLALGFVLGGCAGESEPPTPSATPDVPAPTPTLAPTPTVTPHVTPAAASLQADELGNPLTDYDAIIGYNNFYEFSLSKTDVAEVAADFQTTPWTVQVGGLVAKPRGFDLQELLAFEQVERVYRMRCVEAWSMVIPWLGFPLRQLLDVVQPTAEAQYVRFETLHDPQRMPGQKARTLNWPYVEGLRLDEARHDLTLLATGIYGKPLTPQNGAPIRLVVPWKYGFKGIKSIVRIDLVAEMPVSSWTEAAPSEYGFYANVNPDVPHPRWSQAAETVIGAVLRRPTLLLNGYDEEVGHLYAGMDLARFF
jgi:sulfoxide reductase catalytic subunit YedY